MKRRILSVVSGSVAALLIIAGIEQLTPFFFDLPSHIAWNDKTALTAMVASMPLNAFLMILGGYILAAFTGGLIAGLIATENKTAAAIRVGFVLILGAIMHFVSIPHPRWFIIGSIAVYIPMAYLGGILASGMHQTEKE
jgi:hypothetical protein